MSLKYFLTFNIGWKSLTLWVSVHIVSTYFLSNLSLDVFIILSIVAWVVSKYPVWLFDPYFHETITWIQLARLKSRSDFIMSTCCCDYCISDLDHWWCLLWYWFLILILNWTCRQSNRSWCRGLLVVSNIWLRWKTDELRIKWTTWVALPVSSSLFLY